MNGGKYFEIRDLKVPYAGLGTTVFWYGNKRAEQVMHRALHEGMVQMVDCAEMYGNGSCERTAGRIIQDFNRHDLFIVDKILPQNAAPGRFERSFEASCRRLGTSYIDLYLLHWRADADLSYVAESMEKLKREGRIRAWGVSNFDVSDMEDLFAVKDGDQCVCDQVMYNLGERGIEYDLLPWLKAHAVLPMAYSALGSGWGNVRERAETDSLIRKICKDEHCTPSALMLKFVNDHGVSAVFSTSSYDHLRENLKRMDLDLSRYRSELDQRWPSPDHKVPLAKL